MKALKLCFFILFFPTGPSASAEGDLNFRRRKKFKKKNKRVTLLNTALLLVSMRELEERLSLSIYCGHGNLCVCTCVCVF